MKKYVIAAAVILGLAVAAFFLYNRYKPVSEDDVKLVKQSYLTINQTMGIGDAFDRYKYFKTKEWTAYKENGGRFVKLKASMDIAHRLTPQYYAEIEKKGESHKAVTAVDLIVIFTIEKDRFSMVSANYIYYRKDNTKSDSPERLDTVVRSVYSNEIIPMP
jgi:hypothetical protein